MEKHLFPRVMYSRNIFFSLHKTLVIYLFYSVWANSWEKKAVLEEDGLCSTRKCRRGQWAGICSPDWPASAQPHTGRDGARGQQREQLTSTACICRVCTYVIKCSPLPKLLAILSPPQIISSDIKGVYRQVWETSLLTLQNSWGQILSRGATQAVEAILILFSLCFFF